MSNKTIAELFNLSGKSALVTGGAMGIGEAIASRLAEAGASVVVVDINLDAANQTAGQIKANGGKAHAVKADVRSSADARKAVEATVGKFGQLDILVNNAGIMPVPTPALMVSEEVWENVIATNLKGTFNFSQAAAQQMVNAGHGGRIINVASTSAWRGFGGMAPYDASKAGVIMLTKSLAVEFAPHKILVNAVAAGSTITPGAEAVNKIMCQATGMTREAILDMVKSQIPLGRNGEPDDLAKAVLFLASDAASFVTGISVLVDGGRLLC